ncbi:hypothetical protein [Magnetospirillum fulvum]|uniref:Uncharacterized protein n=1 Tax=Magnetospirillum fulvum MGU-K5 TaxID=1316936 RepID=S9S9X4_MAGFU|nr:hypothetical protein [Magnetospirillum fulvum]EPY00878.1 hypothetical protein K678_13960 [Magnetospirillum fulvum MGU-K5]
MAYRVKRGTIRLNGKKYGEDVPLPLGEDDQDLIDTLESLEAIEAVPDEEVKAKPDPKPSKAPAK